MTMLPSDPMVLVILALALVLAYVNGMHDASNAVSTTIASGTLTERSALAMAAVLNALGALIGIGIALLAWSGSRPERLFDALTLSSAPSHVLRSVLLASVIAAVAWEVLTWWWGMPSSTWHALLSAAAGGSVALGLGVGAQLLGTAQELAVSTVVSPLLGGAVAFGIMHLLARLTLRTGLRTRHLRVAQTISAGAVALGHGMRDSLLPVALIAGALATTPAGRGSADVPIWVLVAVPLLLAAGTFAGGHRIIRTLARRVTDLSTAQGLAAEGTAAIMLLAGGAGWGAPLSTTHTVTAGIVGAGLAVGPRSVRWVTVMRIVAVWVATPIFCTACGAVLARILAG